MAIQNRDTPSRPNGSVMLSPMAEPKARWRQRQCRPPGWPANRRRRTFPGRLPARWGVLSSWAFSPWVGRSSKADEGQDGHDYDHKADEIDDRIHWYFSVCVASAPAVSSCLNGSTGALEHENQKQDDERQGNADHPEQKSLEHENFPSLHALRGWCCEGIRISDAAWFQRGTQSKRSANLPMTGWRS